MNPEPDLAAVASLMADRHRAQMLLALLGGAPQSGSALTEALGISRALASAHLKKLVAGGLVTAQRNEQRVARRPASREDSNRFQPTRKTAPLLARALPPATARCHEDERRQRRVAARNLDGDV